MTLPEGTVTFLRSDIEGSMGLSRALGARYDELNAEHQALVRAAVSRHAGQVVRTEGDALFVVFTEAGAAARAAVDIQTAMHAHAWPEGHEFTLRIGLHAGAATRAGEDYGGFEVNRAARISALGSGGQIVLSDPVRALIAPDLPADWHIGDLGRHRLKGIVEPERLYQLDAPGLDTAFAPLRSGTKSTERLPDRTTLFVGREHELDALAGLLIDSRLLTLTGPGGSGKTTMALELARRVAERYADGAYLVDLQAIRDPDQVRSEIALAIGLQDGATGTAASRLAAFVSEMELLLVIDNFEQVADAASVVGDFLAASPASDVIVTSRVPLKLRAEQEFAVRPMHLEPGGTDGISEAERLFVARVRRVRPDLELTPETREVIVDICRRVDGLPLAIELCAARAAGLPLRAIRDRIVANKPLPGSGPRDLPDRQRTVERTVAWSYDLLQPPVQRLFWRLAAFEGSFDVAQAEIVCGPRDELGVDVLDGLVSLSEQSLLVRVDDASDGVRFGWLETIRDHASERLAASGEKARVQIRHVRAFADLAAEASAHLPGGEQPRWLERLEADERNLAVATRHAIAVEDVESALRLVGSLWRFWLQTGRSSLGRELVAEALSMPGASGPTVLRVRSLDAAGGLAYWASDMATAQALYEEELELAQQIGDRPGEATAWFDLFFTRMHDDDTDRAMAARASAEAIMLELGDIMGLARLREAMLLMNLAGGPNGADGPALPDLDAEAAAAEALDDPWLRRVAGGYRAFACVSRGEFGAAMQWLARALRAALALRERADAALIMQFALVYAPLLGRPDVAATVYGAVLVEFEKLGIRSPASLVDIFGFDPIPQIREALGEEAFDGAVESGRRLTFDEAVDLIDEMATATA